MSSRKPDVQRSPRREAGRAARGRRKRELTFNLVVEGQEMIVTYEAHWSGGKFPYGHFEFRSPHEPPRRILISETGYRSHFAPMADIEASASPADYAREIVQSFLKLDGRKDSEEECKQLDLF